MKILVTGSNGLLGQKLVAGMVSHARHQMLATGKGPCRILHLPENVAYSTCDITRADDLLQLVGSFSPDVVIHAAAMTNVDECELNPGQCSVLNVEATQNVINACKSVNAHLIHISTDFIFDGISGPYREGDAPSPISVYGQSKWEAEKLVMASGCSWAILRTVLVYGISPGLSRTNIVLWVKSSLEQNKEIQVVDDQFRTPTLAEDLAEGCFLAAFKMATGIYNISGKELLTPYAMALKTAAHFGLNAGLIRKASAETFAQPAKRPPRTGFIIEKAERELGYKPHSFEEGIRILESQLGGASGDIK